MSVVVICVCSPGPSPAGVSGQVTLAAPCRGGGGGPRRGPHSLGRSHLPAQLRGTLSKTVLDEGTLPGVCGSRVLKNKTPPTSALQGASVTHREVQLTAGWFRGGPRVGLQLLRKPPWGGRYKPRSRRQGGRTCNNKTKCHRPHRPKVFSLPVQGSCPTMCPKGLGQAAPCCLNPCGGRRGRGFLRGTGWRGFPSPGSGGELTRANQLRALRAGAGPEARTPGPDSRGGRGEAGGPDRPGLSIKQKHFVSGGIF